MKTLNNYISKGFTLFEFIVVVLVVAILSAIIIPKFTYLKTHTTEYTIKKITKNLNVASSSNYKLSKLDSPKTMPISNCQDIKNILPSNQALPNNCSIIPLPITLEHEKCTVQCLYEDGALTITELFVGYKVP